MPTAPSEMETLLAKMVELRETIGLAHQARKDLLSAERDVAKRIGVSIEEAATRYVHNLGGGVQERMRGVLLEAVDSFDRDLREKLGLPKS